MSEPVAAVMTSAAATVYDAVEVDAYIQLLHGRLAEIEAELASRPANDPTALVEAERLAAELAEEGRRAAHRIIDDARREAKSLIQTARAAAAEAPRGVPEEWAHEERVAVLQDAHLEKERLIQEAHDQRTEILDTARLEANRLIQDAHERRALVLDEAHRDATQILREAHDRATLRRGAPVVSRASAPPSAPPPGADQSSPVAPPAPSPFAAPNPRAVSPSSEVAEQAVTDAVRERGDRPAPSSAPVADARVSELDGTLTTNVRSRVVRRQPISGVTPPGRLAQPESTSVLDVEAAAQPTEIEPAPPPVEVAYAPPPIDLGTAPPPSGSPIIPLAESQSGGRRRHSIGRRRDR